MTFRARLLALLRSLVFDGRPEPEAPLVLPDGVMASMKRQREAAEAFLAAGREAAVGVPEALVKLPALARAYIDAPRLEPGVPVAADAEPIAAPAKIVVVSFEPEPIRVDAPGPTAVVTAPARPRLWRKPEESRPLYAGSRADVAQWLKRRGYRYVEPSNGVWTAA